MYPRAFAYHRAVSLSEAASMLRQLGPEAKVLAGGQSLIPLMKLRFANPSDLVDINFVPDLAYIRIGDGALSFGPLTRHAQIESSSEAARVPILHDCAAGIADAQIRNQGTIGGSLAEADPSGDWAPVLLTLQTEVRATGPGGERTLPLDEFITDAYTTALAHEELITEIRVKLPPKNSGGAYIAYKRSAPVYASGSVAVQLTLDDGVCSQARIALGALGLTPIRAREAELALQGKSVTERLIGEAAAAVHAVCDPQSDMRGSAEYKRALAAGLFKEAARAALRRARGERVELSHHYA